MSDVWCLMSDVWCLMSDVWCLMSYAWCLMSDVWCLVSGVWCLVFDVWCLMFDVWCLMFDIWYLINANLEWHTFNIRSLIPQSSLSTFSFEGWRSCGEIFGECFGDFPWSLHYIDCCPCDLIYYTVSVLYIST